MRRIYLLLMGFSLALLALLALSYATAEGAAAGGVASSPFENFPWEAHHHSSSWFSTLSDLNVVGGDVRPVATVGGLSLLLYSMWGLRLGAVAGQVAGTAGQAATAAGQMGSAAGSGGAASGTGLELPWQQAAVHSMSAAASPGLSLGDPGGGGAGQLVRQIGSEADALRSLGRKLQAIPKYGDLIGFFFIIAPRVSRYIQHHPRDWWRMDLFWGDTLGDVLHWSVTLLAGLLGALTGRLLALGLGAGFADLAIVIGDAVLTLVCDQVFTHVPEVDVRLRALGHTVVRATAPKRPAGS